MKQIRVATVKATGSKYVVQQMDFKTEQVYTWGELMRFDTSGRVADLFEGSLKFSLNEVNVVSDVWLDLMLYEELFEQSRLAHAEQLENGKLRTTTSRSRPRGKGLKK